MSVNRRQYVKYILTAGSIIVAGFLAKLGLSSPVTITDQYYEAQADGIISIFVEVTNHTEQSQSATLSGEIVFQDDTTHNNSMPISVPQMESNTFELQFDIDTYGEDMDSTFQYNVWLSDTSSNRLLSKYPTQLSE